MPHFVMWILSFLVRGGGDAVKDWVFSRPSWNRGGGDEDRDWGLSFPGGGVEAEIQFETGIRIFLMEAESGDTVRDWNLSFLGGGGDADLLWLSLGLPSYHSAPLNTCTRSSPSRAWDWDPSFLGGDVEAGTQLETEVCLFLVKAETWRRRLS